jgi:hypothetical protein
MSSTQVITQPTTGMLTIQISLTLFNGGMGICAQIYGLYGGIKLPEGFACWVVGMRLVSTNTKWTI